MNRLENEETNLKKITDVTHNKLMAMSYKKAMGIIADKEKSGEVFTKTDKIKKCQELMVMSYETTLDFIKKDFNYIILIYVLLFSKTKKKGIIKQRNC